MSSEASQNPPRGDTQKAQKYINKLSELLSQGKIALTHTDLQKFDPGTLQDHYTISLKDYQIEISHSKQPDSGNDSYVMIFNNLKDLAQGIGEKVILAYIYLTGEQFKKFKTIAEEQLEQALKIEEAENFNQALEPIDQLLDKASTEGLIDEEEPSENFANSPQIHQV